MRRVLLSLLFIFVPVVAAAQTPPPVESYARLPRVYDAALSPDGRLLAAIIEYEHEYYIRVITLDGSGDGELKLTTLEEGAEVEWIKWASNDRLLISVSQVQYYEGNPVNTGWLITANKDLTDSKVLVKPGSEARQFNNVVVDFLPNDPDHILMSYNDRVTFAPNVMKVNVESGRDERVKLGRDRIQRWFTDDDGEVRVGRGIENNQGDYYLTIRDKQSGKWEEADKYPGISEDTAIFGFSDNPDILWVGCSPEASDTMGICTYDLRARQMIEEIYHNPDYDVAGVVRAQDSKKIVGVSYVTTGRRIKWVDDDYREQFEAIQNGLPGFNVRYLDQTPDGRLTVFIASAPTNPGALMVYDKESGQSQSLALLYPELEDVPQGLVLPVRYTARDGVVIPAFVTLPPVIEQTSDLKNLPFIIFPHGGPYSRDTERFDYWAQFFASRGYGVLQMNFRGSDGYGRDFEDAGRENWQLMLDDIEDGTRWLIEKGYADADRVCIAGGSFGGYAALMGAINDPELYRCTISVSGVTDIGALISDMRSYRFGRLAVRESILKGFDGSRERREASPRARADELTIPVLLVHGEDDVNVEFKHFERMRRGLRGHNSDAVFVGLDDTDHYYRTYDSRLALFQAMDDFLSTYMGPGVLSLD